MYNIDIFIKILKYFKVYNNRIKFLLTFFKVFNSFNNQFFMTLILTMKKIILKMNKNKIINKLKCYF